MSPKTNPDVQTQTAVSVKDVQVGKNTRKSFGKIDEVLQMPNLIEVQKKSYEWFLTEGLREVFRDVASISDFNGNLQLSFIDYRIDDTPKCADMVAKIMDDAEEIIKGLGAKYLA